MRLIGDREVLRTQHSHTISRDGMSPIASGRKSISTSQQRTTEPAVLAAEIEQLPDLFGYVKIPSRAGWLKVRIA